MKKTLLALIVIFLIGCEPAPMPEFTSTPEPDFYTDLEKCEADAYTFKLGYTIYRCELEDYTCFVTNQGDLWCDKIQ